MDITTVLKKNTEPTGVLQEILREIRSVRTAIDMLVPSEKLQDYAHPKRIIASYKRATKQYPPKV